MLSKPKSSVHTCWGQTSGQQTKASSGSLKTQTKHTFARLHIMNNAKYIGTAVNHCWEPHLMQKENGRYIFFHFHVLNFASKTLPATNFMQTYTHSYKYWVLWQDYDWMLFYMGGAKANSRGSIAAASVACICEILCAFAWVYGKRKPVMHTNVRVFWMPLCLPLFSVPFTHRHTRLW